MSRVRMKFLPLAASLALLLLALPGVAVADKPPAMSWRIGDATIVIDSIGDRDIYDQRLEVMVGGRSLVSIEDQRLFVDQWERAPNGTPFPPMGTNVTGGDYPQVIAQGWSGGAHCCTTIQIIDLGPNPRLIPVPIGGDYYAYLRPQPGERGWIAVGYDGVVAYWRASFADSPAPEVLLRFDGKSWRLAADLMRRAPPSEDEMVEMARKVRDLPSWGRPIFDNDIGIPPALWARVLDLTYGGNLTAAERFFDMAWRPGIIGKAAFRRDLFECRLRSGRFWPEIAAMNGRPPLAPIKGCDKDVR